MKPATTREKDAYLMARRSKRGGTMSGLKRNRRFSASLALVVIGSMLATLVPYRAARADDAPLSWSDPASPLGGGAGGAGGLGSTSQPSNSPEAPALAAADLATGAARSTFQFDLPPARGEVEPLLKLEYSSATNVGFAGMGWTLALPSIVRKGTSGLPEFIDPKATGNTTFSSIDTSDDFYFDGRLLVPICVMDDAGCPQLQAGEVLPHVLVTTELSAPLGPWIYYRAEEDDGSRYFFSATGQTWMVQTKSGHVQYYGHPLDGLFDDGIETADAWTALIAPNSIASVAPSSSTTGNPAYRWNLVRDAGLSGNTVYYTWSSTLPSVAGATRLNGVQYLTDINDTAGSGVYAHHTHLNWDVDWHLIAGSDPNLLANPSPIWRASPLAVLTGVDVTSASLTSTALQMVRRYHLTYQPNTLNTRLYLQSIALEGSCAPVAVESNGLLGATNCPQLPKRTFTYYPDLAVNSGSITVNQTPAVQIAPLSSDKPAGAWAPSNQPHAFVDINGDARQDLVYGVSNEHYVPLGNPDPNTGDWSFEPWTIWADLGGVPTGCCITTDYSLVPSQAALLPTKPWSLAPGGGVYGDWLANGQINQLEIDTGSVNVPVFTPTLNNGFQKSLIVLAPSLGTAPAWNNANAVDVDGDGLVDMTMTPDSGGTQWTYLSSRDWAGETFAFSRQLALGFGTTPTPVSSMAPVDYQRYYADMDGDGLADLVVAYPSPTTNKVTFDVYPNRGNGTYGTGFAQGPYGFPYTLTGNTLVPSVAPFSPFGAQAAGLDGALLRIGDLNGDGLSDYALVTDTLLNNPDGSSFRVLGELTICLRSLAQPATSAFVCNTPISTDSLGWQGPRIPFGNQFSTTQADMMLDIADVDGSGLPRLVWSHLAGWFGKIRVCPNGLPGIVPFSDCAWALNPQGTPYLKTFQAYTPGAHPGYLQTVTAETGLQTTLDYGYEADPEGFGSPVQVPVWFVKDATTTNQLSGYLGHLEATSYQYEGPIYDPRDKVFAGFQTVTATTQGDPNAPGLSTTTYFATQSCVPAPGVTPQGPPCTGTQDYSYYRLLRGVPAAVEEKDGQNHVLRTTINSYTWTRLYAGVDGRKVVSSLLGTRHTYLGDPKSTAVGSVAVAIVGNAVLFGFQNGGPGLTVEIPASPGETQTIYTYDAFDNMLTSSESGFFGNGSDYPIQKTLSWSLAPGELGGWAYRVTTQSVQQLTSPAPPARVYSYDYDSAGRLKDVFGNLAGTVPLQPPSGGVRSAGAPPSASRDNPNLLLASYSYDTHNQGNLVLVQGTNGHCATFQYDSGFNLVPLESVQFSDACNGTGLQIDRKFDLGLGAITLESTPYNPALVSPRNYMVHYDGFGRVIEVDQPDSVFAVLPAAAPAVTVQYLDAPPIRWTEVLTVDGPDGQTSTVEHLTAQDGFGDTLIQLDASGAAGASQWNVSGIHSRYENGLTEQLLAPFQFTGPPAAAVLLVGGSATMPAGPTATFTYDGLGRLASSKDFRGFTTTRTLHVGPSGSSIDIVDPEQAGGEHPNSYTTLAIDGHGRVAQEIAHLANTAAGPGTVTTSTTYLPTGEPSVINQTFPGGSYTRWMQYDTLGRLVFNAEPNTSTGFSPVPNTTGVKGWTYAYDDNGDLVGTSDARGCGENLYYDALGRVTAEDYSTCASWQAYTKPTLPGATSGTVGDGTEGYNLYDGYGQLLHAYDRAQHSDYGYDNRGRLTSVQRQLAKPTAATALAGRYAPHEYTKAISQYSEANRPLAVTSGLDAGDWALFGGPPTSQVTIGYSLDGIVQSVGSSYGTLLTSQAADATGAITGQVLGDAAHTQVTLGRDANENVKQYTVARKNGPWTGYIQHLPSMGDPDHTLQGVLTNLAITCDGLGNPRTVSESTTQGTPITPSQWPPGAVPAVSRNLTYWDDYRLREATTQYDTSNHSDAFASPNQYDSGDTYPAITSEPNRVQDQTFSYDWRGNVLASDDAPTHDFFDRSLGNAGMKSQNEGPDQIVAANSQDGKAGILVTHDDAGNMTVIDMSSSSSPGLDRLYSYTWDEVGRLAGATRSDASGSEVVETFAYTADGERIRTSRQDPTMTSASHTVHVFDSLVLKSASFPDGLGDYVHDEMTENVYLGAGGATLAHTFYSSEPMPSTSIWNIHTFLTLGDQVGSTSMIIDHDTGELVERINYLAYGAAESDYRPQRWSHFREDARFNGQWDDTEVGLTYLNARYYSPNLQRFISPDPATIHGLGADPNPYAFASGSPGRYGDPSGLDDAVEQLPDDFIVGYAPKPVATPSLPTPPDPSSPTAGVGSPQVIVQAQASAALSRVAQQAAAAARTAAYDRPLQDDPVGNALVGLLAGPIEGVARAVGGLAVDVGSAAASFAKPLAEAAWARTPGLVGLGSLGGGELVAGQAAAEGAAGVAARFATTAERAAVLEHAVTSEGALNASQTVARQLAGQRGFIPVQAILDTIGSGVRVADPQGVAGQFMYRAGAAFNGSEGTLEVLVDEASGQINHVLFRSGVSP